MSFSSHYHRWMRKISKYRKSFDFLEDEIYLVIGNLEDGEYSDLDKVKDHLNSILDNLIDVQKEVSEHYEQ